MRRILTLCCLLLTLAWASSSAHANDQRPRIIHRVTDRATYTVTAQAATVFPNDRRTAQVVITPQRPLDLVVLQVHLTSEVHIAGAEGCMQARNERTGAWDEPVCQIWHVTEPITLDITLAPLRIVTDPIGAACAFPLVAGVPLSLAENGQEVLYRRVAWSPYWPGYCAYLPAATP